MALRIGTRWNKSFELFVGSEIPLESLISSKVLSSSFFPFPLLLLLGSNPFYALH
jgi:hypothetical protein